MKQTVIFSGTCLAAAELTLVSKRINYPFKILSFNASFALNTNRTLKLRCFISPDKSASTTGEPTGQNIFATLGEDSYLIGDDEQKNLKHEVNVRESGMYLKIHAENIDTFAHTVDAFIVIETLVK